uniref:Rieske domain-containing protein n=1 Tax=Ditylum brightwellii TaxID=49249 RepID=A0A7S1Z823_9STRA
MVETSTEAQSDSQNLFGIASDAVTGVLFSLLHAFDDCGIADSSKNLRVLWVRALLNHKGKIKDEVAATFLPPTTRGLVTSDSGAQLLEPILKFAEWIQARTDFIDASLGNFLSSPVCKDPETGEALECNIVLFGAGYDTRALRYRHEHEGKINFIEVDLPSVVEGKGKLYEKFQREQDPEWDLQNRGSKLIPFDLNDCGGENPTSLIDTLRTQGKLKENVPTFLVWEAVLFYVNEDAVRNIMNELFAFVRIGGNGGDPRAETMLCFTDSLKPFVDVPFTNEARKFFNGRDLDLVQHRARWGGAVHFALATTKGAQSSEVATTTKEADLKPTGKIGMHIKSEVGNLVNSYTPTQSNNPAVLRQPSFDNTWYAVAYPWQIDGYETPLDATLNRKNDDEVKPFATRLWGEPLVIYRDGEGKLVALADVCPHRSAPLSMGKVENGELACMYHGWKFGAKGACTDIPTLRAVDDEDNILERDHSRTLSRVTNANCGNNRAVVEHEGLVYIWRGNVLEADPSLLPSRRKGDMETVPIDTVLDYNVDYSYIVENNLDSPHLFYLHDGSVPPIESIGMLNNNLPKLKLTAFTDDCGMGHLGRFGVNGRPKKLLRFDPPNIVRHGGVSGFEEEFHIVPIAPQRTRVLLRQHLPRGPILSTITGIPGLKPVLTQLVNNWNYHIGLEDACVMQGQASRIEDWGSPRLAVGGLGDDLIKRYWKWRSEAHEELKKKGQNSPYMVEFSGQQAPASIPSGTSFGDDPELVARIRADSRLRNSPLVSDNKEIDERTGSEVGTWGILSDYVQNTPAANFPPVNYKQYKNLLVLDDFIKGVFQKDADAPVDAVGSHS